MVCLILNVAKAEAISKQGGRHTEVAISAAVTYKKRYEA
jgi:hypothetical protein